MEGNFGCKKIANFLKGTLYGNAKTGFKGLEKIIKELEKDNINNLSKQDLEKVYGVLVSICYLDYLKNQNKLLK